MTVWARSERRPGARHRVAWTIAVVAAAAPLALSSVGVLRPSASLAERAARPRGAVQSPHTASSPREASSVPRRKRPRTALRFAVLGDFGAGGTAQKAVADAMCRWRTKHYIRLVVTTGDNIYPDGSPALFQSEFYTPYSCLFAHGVHFHGSLGNHDVLTANGDFEVGARRFGMNGHNYVLRKSGVRLVFADSNSLDRTWLRGALQARRGDRWTVVVFHHPVFSPGTQNGSTPGFRPGLPRIFRRRGVDLVLNGHDHIYAATKSLHGIRYVVSGGGGSALNGCSTKWFSATCIMRYHFLYVVAGRKAIAVRAVSTRDRVFSRFRTTGRD